MRSFVMVLVVVCLLAAPSVGVVNVRIVPAERWLYPGERTVVTIEVMTGEAGVGVYSLAGSVVPTVIASYPPVLVNVGDLTFDAAYMASSSFPYDTGAAANGGVAGFGSVRTGVTNADNHGDLEWVPFATYTVEMVNKEAGIVSLDFVEGVHAGWMPLDSSYGGLGTVTPATIYREVPEPATMALLALGGVVMIRRRK